MSDERKKIEDQQILVMLIVDKSVVQDFILSLKQNIPDAESCQIKKPTCTASLICPTETINELLAELRKCELQYVAILHDSYFTDIPNIHTAIQKYEVECSNKKRLLTRRVKVADSVMEYRPLDDFDLGHDFVFGKRGDVLTILQDKQSGKHSIGGR